MPETYRQTNRRLYELDGLRALAILIVMAFHFFQRFPTYYPYGDEILSFARYGYLGVDLFFVISGFVIALSIQNANGVLHFAYKRWTRLWPAMFVCSVMTFLVMHLISTDFTAFRRTGFESFLPSLTFTDPSVWSRFAPDAKFQYIDGAYWSLFVEVRFYFWAAVIGSISKSDQFGRNAVLFFAAAFAAYQLAQGFGYEGIEATLSLLFFPQYLHLFCAGILFCDAWNGKNPRFFYPAIGICFVVTFYLSDNVAQTIITFVWFILFSVLIYAPSYLALFRFRPLVWIGVISYPLYLLHQNIGVALISLAPAGWDNVAYLVLVSGVSTLLFLLASVLHFWVEKPIQNALRHYVSAL